MRSTPSSSADGAGAAGDAAAARGTPSPWLRIEVDTDALAHNAALFRRLVPPPARLLAVVKADAYGHGLVLASRAFLAGGADVLGVHSLAEAVRLRAAGVAAPILVLGPLTADEAAVAARLDAELTVVSLEMAREIAAAATGGRELRVHLKLETGVQRQGIVPAELAETLATLAGAPDVRLVGLSSHYADIEDTTDHAFAERQGARFAVLCEEVAARGHPDLVRHMSCSAAAILWSETHRDLVRVGISAYGIWPSRETLVSARAQGRSQLDLRPALTWKCRISQVKTVAAGDTVGYGRTWRAPVESRLAVLPVGYADGYRRALSGVGHVLVRGRRAPLRGRICMNLCMADVTHVPAAAAGDWAVLLGREEDDAITAETLAGWLNTIPYEVLTLPGATWSRVAAPAADEGTR
jgi:alanine racemase